MCIYASTLKVFMDFNTNERYTYLRNRSGLLLLSIYILARALCVAGSVLPSCVRVSSHGRMSFSLFLFSTSSTSSSVENCPLTTKTSCLMTSSVQSTSSKPPTTTGKRDGLTCNDAVNPFPDFEKQSQNCQSERKLHEPFARISRCTSEGCSGTDREQDRERNQICRRRWSKVADRSAWPPSRNSWHVRGYSSCFPGRSFPPLWFAPSCKRPKTRSYFTVEDRIHPENGSQSHSKWMKNFTWIYLKWTSGSWLKFTMDPKK